MGVARKRGEEGVYDNIPSVTMLLTCIIFAELLSTLGVCFRTYVNVRTLVMLNCYGIHK